MLDLPRRALLTAALPTLLQLSGPIAAPTSLAYLPATSRTVAIGDVHGDADALIKVLRLAGLIDKSSAWSGGDATLVQIGDVLDRGPQEYECLALLRSLKQQAAASGGRVVTLLGNHEVLNACGVTVYASEEGQEAFGESRSAAFSPGGPLAMELSTWPVACVVGDTAFVHAGLTPALVSAGLGTTNAAAASWLRGEAAFPPPLLLPSASQTNSPVWTRELGVPKPTTEACDALSAALSALNARRLVIGHTVQPEGITCACDERCWRVDVGLSRAMMSGTPQALEIRTGGSVRTLVG